MLVGRGDRRLARSLAGRHGDHPVAGRELRLQCRAGGGGNGGAPLQQSLGGALGDDHPVAAVVLGQDRDRAAFVIERQRVQPPVAGQRRLLLRGGRGLPQRDVEGVPAGRLAVLDHCLVAQQPQQRLVIGRAVRPGRAHEPQAALGQRAGLVVNSTSTSPRSSMHTSRLTRTLGAGQLPRPGGQAGRDHRREQLRRDAHRDRQREQQRGHHRFVQREVDDEDRASQHAGHLDQQHRELAQPGLELGLRLPLSQALGDTAELRVPAGRHHSAGGRAGRTTVPISAQQRSSASAVPAATGSVNFSTGSDSPVRTDSSHSSPAVVSSRISAGTTWPSCRSATSPGTSSVTSTVCGCPSRHTTQR